MIESEEDIDILQDDLNKMIEGVTNGYQDTTKKNVNCYQLMDCQMLNTSLTPPTEHAEKKESKVKTIKGVTFDSSLEKDIHINEKLYTASSICVTIRRSYKTKHEAFMHLCKALVRSHLE